jgi:hypothetical protein
MKAENILKKNGLAILLIPAPRALSTDCGLAIRYNNDLYERVLQALKDGNLLPTFIYRKDSNTHYEVVWHTESNNDSVN